MAGIDAHVHCWDYVPARDTWITPEMGALQHDFHPGHLKPLLAEAGLKGCVLVQHEQTAIGTQRLLDLAVEHDAILGVVGWADLCDPELTARLDEYRTQPLLKGFRHVLQDNPERDFMLRSEFRRGIGTLRERGYSYDILVLADQLPFVHELVLQFPEQPFVIDHLAKPPIRSGDVTEWADWMRRIALQENVHCKLSGMVTEADWAHWTAADMRPYLDVVTEAFGTSRLMYGSDWPVCLLAADYATVKAVVSDYFGAFSEAERHAIFGANASRFYNLQS